jgi:tetratricopeptide (TPR) repeat protein
MSLEDAGDERICPRCSLQRAIGAVGAEGTDQPSVPGYEIIHLLGRGAMGVVWLAREVALDRLVALKLIPTGGDPALGQRLLREGQAAAQLKHPNIVAVHALGGSGSATFLAMDFHEGGNLEHHLQGRPMQPRAAAELGRKLAGALAHAHAAGVLHRDLKPSNVLLDGAGEPLLADFGLAGPLEGRGDLTRPGELGGTPAFLAPELIDGQFRPSVATDVYGLGVVLYVALTGRPPFAAESVAGLLRAVATAEPVAPRILQPAIPRDLETIVRKCLEKSPAQRYPSAQAIQDELGRFLRGEAIQAHPVGAVGSALRWCKRRPAVASALALAITIVLLLAVGGPLVALRLERSRRAIAESAATATAIADFLQVDLLGQASPNNQPNRDLKLKTVVDQAAAKIETRFRDRPAVEASIRQTLGDTYFALGEYKLAQHHLERALALREPNPGQPMTAETVKTLTALGSALFYQGQMEGARALVARAVQSGERDLGEDNTEVVLAFNVLGLIEQTTGQVAAGEKLLTRALEIRQRQFGAEDPYTLVFLNNLALSYGLQNRYDKVAEAEGRVLQARLRISGHDHPDTLAVMGNLGYASKLMGDLPKAEALDRDVYETLRRVSGPEHLFTVVAQAELGQIYKLEGRLPEAERLTAEAFAISQRTLGPAHPQALTIAGEYGEILLREKQPEQAEKILRAALEGAPLQPPGNAWRRALLESRWGEALLDLDRLPEAEKPLLAAAGELEKLASRPGPWNRSEVGFARARLHRLYEAWGKPDLARAWSPQA